MKSDLNGAKLGCSDPDGASESANDKTMEGYLFLRIHVRRRRYCVLKGRTLHVFDSKEECSSVTKGKAAVAKKIIAVVGVKDAMELEKTVRSSLLGNPTTFENALVISTQKSKLVVVEAETHTEKQRWLHAMSCLNFASSSSEKTFFLSMLEDTASFDAHVAVTLLHKYRNNEVATELIIDRLAEYSERNIDDVEFYIQQIMHLVVNAEMTKTDKLVHLLLSICKAKAYVEHLGNCIHLALQLFWLLEAKIQDKDPKTYNLCAKLLMSIEAKVVNQHFELPKSHSADGVSSLLMEIPGMRERLQTMTRQKSETLEHLQAVALKESSSRPEEATLAATKPSAPLTIDTRSISISGEHAECDAKSLTSGFSTVTSPNAPSAAAVEAKQQRELLLEWMEKERQKRYKYFHQQRDFVKALTDISEKMRLIDPPQERKKHLPAALEKLEIPEMAYIPLGRVTDPFCRITRVLTNEGTVFSTHSRAPCLLCFEVIEDHVNAAGHRSSSAKLGTTASSPRQSRSPHRRVNSTSTCSSVGDEEAEVLALIKKYSINGKVICFDEHSLAGSEYTEDFSANEGEECNPGDSKQRSISPRTEELTALQELDKQLDIAVTIEDEEMSGDPPCLSISVRGDSLASSASIPNSSIADECSLIRRHSKTAYEFGLSKMLSDSGVFGESWKEKKVTTSSDANITLPFLLTPGSRCCCCLGAYPCHIPIRSLVRMECDLAGKTMLFAT